MLVGGSAEPMGAQVDEEKAKDETQKWNMFRHIQTKKCVYMWNKWTGWKAVVHSNWDKMVGGEVHNAISTLCSGWVTENV